MRSSRSTSSTRRHSSWQGLTQLQDEDRIKCDCHTGERPHGFPSEENWLKLSTSRGGFLWAEVLAFMGTKRHGMVQELGSLRNENMMLNAEAGRMRL